MTLKFTMDFLQGRASWTETHYHLAGSSIPSDIGDFLALARARGSCLGSGAYLTGFRISEIPANRLVRDTGIDAPGFTGIWQVPDPLRRYAATLPNVSILLRLNSGTPAEGSPKSIYLGCPPGAVVNTGFGGSLNFVFDPLFSTPLGAYMLILTGSSKEDGTGGAAQTVWGYRTRATVAPQRVMAMVQDAFTPAHVGLTVQAAIPGVVVGGEVWVAGFRRLSQRGDSFGGAYKVWSITPPTAPAITPYTYYLAGTGDVFPSNFDQHGTIQTLAYDYIPYGLGYSIVKAVTHKRGGSLGAPRGRLLHRN